ncbi:copper resistance protein CopC [Microbacterium sp. NPDC058342]|uniref:copper resistance CopC family protein n=1 Tax=Microbacterium sp. NPDC058342 TaxID=3346454 RepID=UPI003663F48A
MSRIRTVLPGAAVAVAAVLAVAAPASAHDVIVSSSPAADEQLTAAPEQIVLTFSNDLLALEENNGTAMTVVDSDGEDWVAGDPVVAADTVTVPLEAGMPNGEYQVTWKVVSSDGHPTSGEYAFSVAAAETAPTPTASAETATDQPEDTPTSSESETPDADPAPWPLLIGLGVVVVAAIVIVIVIAGRRRRS